MAKLFVKIGLSVVIVAAGIALVGLAYHFNPIDSKPDSDEAIFKLAHDGIVTGFEKENNQEWKEDFVFIQAADPQFGLMEAFSRNPNETNLVASNWTEERSLLHEAVDQWNKLKPVFVIICGDLVNDMPKSEQPNSVRREQLDDLKTELRRANVKLLFLAGNHDVGNTPTEHTVNEYVDEFGSDHYSFWYSSVLFLSLNSQLYKDHSKMDKQYKEQNEWLEERLKFDAPNATHVVVFQHIPWFLHDAEKPDPEDYQYFEIELEERKKMLKSLYDGNVRWIFSGHYHRNANGTYNGDLHMITTSAIGAQMKDKPNAKSGYRKVQVTKTGITHDYIDIRQ